MARYSIAVDVSRCDGCGSCWIACKDEYCLNDHLPTSVQTPMMGQTWLTLKEIEQGENWKIKMDYIPVMCQHCENPKCAEGAPEGAVYKREDGIVIIDPVKAKGCKELVDKCPYGVIYWNEQAQVAQKCTMCAHMLDNGEKTTRCVESCPTQAIFFGDLDDPNSPISKFIEERGGMEQFGPYRPEEGTKPRILYKELPQVFVAGEVLLEDKKDDCCEGAKVAIKNVATGETRETATDFFGDFEFKFLTKGAEYEIACSYEGYKPQVARIVLDQAKDLGQVVLKKA